MTDWRPDIFEYVDYRKFLSDYYAAAKENSRVFSYRYLARRAGFSSPNFIKLVMDGKRNLGDESIESVAKAFDLDEDEARFFAALVEFDQAATADQQNEAFEAIAASRRFRSARRIDHGMFEYLSHWYYPAIREMAAREDFTDDPEWIAEQLWPRVSRKKVERALELLFDYELLVRQEDGSVSRGEPTLTTGHEVNSLAIGNFHRQMMERAADSIVNVDRELRDISGQTVCIPSTMVATMKERIHEFRESMLELCDSKDSPTEVYQLNVQLFPLTRAEVQDDE